MPDQSEQQFDSRRGKTGEGGMATYRSLLCHWAAQSVRAPAATTVEPMPTVQAGQVALRFGGHASVIVRYHNLIIACDPMMGNWCGAAHREVTSGLCPKELSHVDLVLLSQNAVGHLHRRTLEQIQRSATIIGPQYSARDLSRFGFARVVELGPDQSVEHRRVTIYAVEVRHKTAKAPALGYVIRGDGPTVFFCAGSGYFAGFAPIGTRLKPDIALLPIGGYAPNPLRRDHMNPKDALQAFEDLRAKVMIPVRYGSFALSYEDLRTPERWLGALARDGGLLDRVVVLQPGQTRIFGEARTTAATKLRD